MQDKSNSMVKPRASGRDVAVTDLPDHGDVGGFKLKNLVQASTRYKGWTKSVYAYYAEHYDAEKGYAWPRIDKVASDLGCSLRTVQRALDTLEADGRMTQVWKNGRAGGRSKADANGKRHGRTTLWVVIGPDA